MNEKLKRHTFRKIKVVWMLSSLIWELFVLIQWFWVSFSWDSHRVIPPKPCQQRWRTKLAFFSEKIGEPITISSFYSKQNAIVKNKQLHITNQSSATL